MSKHVFRKIECTLFFGEYFVSPRCGAFDFFHRLRDVDRSLCHRVAVPSI